MKCSSSFSLLSLLVNNFLDTNSPPFIWSVLLVIGAVGEIELKTASLATAGNCSIKVEDETVLLLNEGWSRTDARHRQSAKENVEAEGNLTLSYSQADKTYLYTMFSR